MVSIRTFSHVLAVTLIAVLLLQGCGKNPPAPRPAAPINDTKPERRAEPKVKIVYLYLPDFTSGSLRMVGKKIEYREGAAESPMLFAMMKLTEAKTDGKPLFPTGTRFISWQQRAKGDIYVDFSDEIKGFSGGSDEEAGIVNAIVLTAAQFDNARTVTITAGGRELETLGGHSDLTAPQRPDWTLVSESKQ